MGAIREGGSFFVRPPQGGDWVFRALRGGGVQRLALLPGKGGILFPKRIPPWNPQRKARGHLSTPHIGSLGLERPSCLRNALRCTWLRHGSLRVVGGINRALLRGARVTVAGPPVPAGPCGIASLAAWRGGAMLNCGLGCLLVRHCFARRGWMKQMLQFAGIYGTVAIGRCTNGRRLATSSERRW